MPSARRGSSPIPTSEAVARRCGALDGEGVRVRFLELTVILSAGSLPRKTKIFLRTLATVLAPWMVLERFRQREREAAQLVPNDGPPRPHDTPVMPIPVILDCDPGHDDAIALLLRSLVLSSSSSASRRRTAIRHSRRRRRTRSGCSSSWAGPTSPSQPVPTGRSNASSSSPRTSTGRAGSTARLSPTRRLPSSTTTPSPSSPG